MTHARAANTIAALATAPHPAGLAVIRVSGPETRRAMQALFRAKQRPTSHPRQLIFGKVVNYKTGKMIDKAMAVFMPGPKSYTGEDIGEFHIHGSMLLVQRVLRSLYAYGIAPAEPGEFTKRAFLNGKIDLLQAEAIADVIAAGSDQALKLASEQMRGRFSDALDKLGEPLRNILAELEASIDFPEEDIETASLERLQIEIKECRAALHAMVDSYNFGQSVREGFRILLSGRPNAGKSSLLNLFLGSERAIVTDIPGTTRDLIEESTMISGYRFVFCDSAGITETKDKVEKIGIDLAESRVEWADLVLLVIDGNEPSSSPSGWRAVYDRIKPKAKKIWFVINKIDTASDAVSKFSPESGLCDRIFFLSAKTKEGLDHLREALIEEIGSRLPESAAGSVIITNERHRDCLVKAEKSLANTDQAISQGLPTEVITAELRAGLNALNEIIGKTWNEDILGRIFSKFCIGK